MKTKKSKTPNKTPNKILTETLSTFPENDRWVRSKSSGKDTVFIRQDIVEKAIENAMTEKKSESNKDEVAFLNDFKNCISDSYVLYLKNQHLLGEIGLKQVVEFLYNTISNVASGRIEMLEEGKTYEGLKEQSKQELIKKTINQVHKKN